MKSSMSKINKRNNGIDLLRIVSMYMICCLHILLRGGILKSIETECQNKTFWLLEIICLCAVDCFALISGYVSSCNTFNIKRILSFWSQVVFYSFVITLILFVLKYSPIPNMSILVDNLFPIINRKYWYATDYLICMCTVPIIMNFSSKIKVSCGIKVAALIIAYFILTSIFYRLLNNGCSFIWLCFLYLVGYEMKESDVVKKIDNLTITILMIILFVISYIGKIYLNNDYFINNTSITIFSFSFLLVILFAKNDFNISSINKLNNYYFGVYLFQCNEIIWSLISNSFIFVLKYSPLVGLLFVLLFSLLLFCAGIIVEIIRKLFFNRLGIDKLINNFSYKLVSMYLQIKKIIY